MLTLLYDTIIVSIILIIMIDVMMTLPTSFRHVLFV